MLLPSLFIYENTIGEKRSSVVIISRAIYSSRRVHTYVFYCNPRVTMLILERGLDERSKDPIIAYVTEINRATVIHDARARHSSISTRFYTRNVHAVFRKSQAISHIPLRLTDSIHTVVPIFSLRYKHGQFRQNSFLVLLSTKSFRD